jgi:methyl-accepting chemotaxis protein
VQAFAVEDVAAKLRQVAALIVDNRAEVQGAWSASQQLEKTAAELEGLVGYFD